MPRYFDYIIADVRLRSNSDIAALGLKGFKPFEAEVAGEPIATINISHTSPVEAKGAIVSTSYLSETNADSVLMRTDSGYAYYVTRRDGNKCQAAFHIDTSNNIIDCNIALKDHIDISILRFGLWVMFGIVIAPLRGIAIHSSTIEYNGRCSLFLGESGTGKSTHTRLWRENITGARLLNDDSPIIRMIDGEARVYGSPWSGKTPCYINRDFPIAGFVRLRQAPHNKIKRLNPLVAIGALLPSCPHLFAEDETLQDELCKTLSEVIATTHVYTMECLPNSDAACLSNATLYSL